VKVKAKEEVDLVKSQRKVQCKMSKLIFNLTCTMIETLKTSVPEVKENVAWKVSVILSLNATTWPIPITKVPTITLGAASAFTVREF